MNTTARESLEAAVANARCWSSLAFSRWHGRESASPDAPPPETLIRTAGLAPFLYRTLANDDTAIARAFAADYRHAATANLIRLAHGARVRDDLEGAGLSPILLKGGAFLVRLGPDDVGIRPMADLDLLVDADRFRDAEACLRAAGFEAASDRSRVSAVTAPGRSFIRRQPPLDLEIDLHRALAPWPLFPHLTRSVRDRAERLSGWLVPSVPDAIAHAATHRASHAFVWSASDLMDLRDLIDLVNADDWSACVADFARLDALGAVYAALRQAIFVFGDDATGEASARLTSLAARLHPTRRRWIDRIAPAAAAFDPHLHWDRPIARNLVVRPLVSGSPARAVVAGALYLPLRAADEWINARAEGRDWRGRLADVRRHVVAGARGTRPRDRRAAAGAADSHPGTEPT